MKNQVAFRVVNLAAAVSGGIPIEWQGREFASGPLIMALDPESEPGSGLLDYQERRARAEFRVLMHFPELARMLEEFGADAEFSVRSAVGCRAAPEFLPYARRIFALRSDFPRPNKQGSHRLAEEVRTSRHATFQR